MSIPAGVMTEKFGGKFVMLFAFGIALIGALLFGLFPKYNMAIISLFLIGSGMAMLQVVINPLLRSAGGEAVMDLLQHVLAFIGGVSCGLSIAVLVLERREAPRG